jgi:hypothetical protein
MPKLQPSIFKVVTKLLFKFSIFLLIFFVHFKITSLYQEINDFCQDYLSASWVLHKLPAYQPFNPYYCWGTKAKPFISIQYNARPPTSLIFFIPFTLTSLSQATIFFDALSIGAFFLSMAFLLSIIRQLTPNRYLFALLCSTIWITLQLNYAVRNLTFLLLALTSMAYYCTTVKKLRYAGIFIGLAALIKLWPAIFLIPVMFQKPLRPFLYTGLMIIFIGTVISILLFGPHNLTMYIFTVLPFEKTFFHTINNISLPASLNKIGFNYSFIVSLFGFIWIIKRLITLFSSVSTDLYFAALFSLLSMGYFVFSPISWDHSAIQLLLPLAIFLRYLKVYPHYLIHKYSLAISLSFLPLMVPHTIELIDRGVGLLPPHHLLIILLHFVTVIFSCLPLLFILKFSRLITSTSLKKRPSLTIKTPKV